ncbi:YbjP/YqhG family protein [Franconibacter sp. IITDAS19]|uniref:DUF3828 domain-containing protein n=1 Tax=Franconibacter pulveris TaxID=435910 RepID=A0A0J8VM70_9ENTR|nr:MULTISPECIES: YbjP/YqhG family protein [Franconibacter]KMV34598.1 hypothetical protein ACH50_10625 [Franconibacter pulveris]MCK1968932.1 YbjP/YqhG family protein [Franconibacter sp. IITDAS19]
MMRIMMLALAFMLAACSSGKNDVQSRVAAFYQQHLSHISASDNDKPRSEESFYRNYVSAETLSRLDKISALHEQEILSADYFSYTQDYAPEWISRLKTGAATDFMGGKVMDVWLGIENNQRMQLRVYLRLEDNVWKIYRVRDITDNYEQPIFNNAAIKRAEAWSAHLND